MAYYGRFYRSKLSAVLARINAYVVRWIRNKYRRLDRTRAAHRKLAELATGQPRLFGTGLGYHRLAVRTTRAR